MISLLRRLRGRRRMRELQNTCTSAPVWPSAVIPAPQGVIVIPPEPTANPQLPCHGCAHSAANAPFPGHPSGERPCGFCVRNPDGIADWWGEKGPRWYDGETPPFRTPMDCYIATDRLQQQRVFDELRHLELTGEKAPERVNFGDSVSETWCCDGGPAPGGHTWTCWGWLGISFG